MNIRVFTSFSGYDNQCLALKRLAEQSPDFSYELVGWSDIDKYAIKAHNALFPQWAELNYGDISKIDWEKVPDFDLFTYSSPCQDFSQAGLQRGGEKGSGTRSSLLWECERAIVAKRPKYLLMENVAALVGKKFIRLFNEWQLTLERYGYRNFAKVLNAKYYGVPQNRSRIFMVSIREDVTYADKFGTHHIVRYEFPKPIPLTLRLKDVLEQNVDEKYYLNAKLLPCVLRRIDKKRTILNGMSDGTAAALTAKSSPSSQTNMIGVQVLFDLQPENKWQDSVTREQNKVVSVEHIAPTLNSTISKHAWKIAEPIMLGWSRNDKGEVENYHQVEIANTITSAKRDNTQNYIVEPKINVVGLADGITSSHRYCREVIDPEYISKAVCSAAGMGGNMSIKIIEPINAMPDGTCRTLKAQYQQIAPANLKRNDRFGATGVLDGYRIRKLTPRECFRLMDVDDTDTDKIQAAGISDSQQYKMAGNSIVVACLYHIFNKLFVNTDNEEQQLTLF